MSSELGTLVLQLLAESGKSAPEIGYWIGSHTGEGLYRADLLRAAIDGLEAAGLIELYTKRMVQLKKGSKALWIYRLTADGALTQWAGEVSVPKEMSPA